MQRYIVLTATCAVSLCIGCGLAWSVNQIGLIDESVEIFGKEISEPSIAFAFTIYCGVSPIPMIVVGAIQKRFSIKKILVVSALIYCGGIFLAGFTSSRFILYMTYGIMGGMGSSALFNAVLNNLLPFFPDRKGFATGMLSATYGSSSLICTPIMHMLIQAKGVLFNLRLMGVIFAVVIGLAIIFIKQHPEVKSRTYEEKRYPIMLKDNRFPFIFIIFTGFAVCGLMMINQVGSMTRFIHGSSGMVAPIIMTISIMNVTGRICWGWLSDKIGRHAVIIITSAILICSGLILIVIDSLFAVFVVCAMAILFAYGGCMGVIPALLADCYGMKNNAMNYGILCVGYAIGGYIGPIISANQFMLTGSYKMSFILMSITAMLVLLAGLRLRKLNQSAV